MKGVNLGGWLVLERWITPSLFEGLEARDEYSFSIEKGTAARTALNNHRESFISPKDFKWIASQGMDAVRLPIGYWALGGVEPYIECKKYIDFAFSQCQKNNLGLLLDIHALPGSQNGYNHSGKGGNIGWGDSETIHASTEFIKKIVSTYGSECSILGIELMNEPSSKISGDLLRQFYKQAYAIIRKEIGKDTLVVISDAFETKKWKKSMPRMEYDNVFLDMHLYQVFSRRDKRLNLQKHIEKAQKWRADIVEVQKNMPVIIGEWSAALPPEALRSYDFNDATAKYANAQLDAFSQADGWFYWNYKTETMKGWNFRQLVDEGVLNIKVNP